MERFNRLLALQKKLTMEVQSSMVGKRLEVLVEGAGKKEGQMYGRTSGNRVVNFSGCSRAGRDVAETADCKKLPEFAAW